LDSLIRYGLLLAWLAFGFAVLWWWRRRLASKHYAYSERASTILQAIKQSADLGLVYWSRSEKRFLRRIVTPLELDGYSMKAFDHTANDVRTFKVTRIKVLEIVERGSQAVPPRLTVPASTWALGGLGVVALTMLALFLFRGRDTMESPPLSTNFVPFEVSATPSTSEAALETAPSSPSPKPADMPAPAPAAEVALPDVSDVALSARSASTGASSNRWALIVVDSPDYETNLLPRVLCAVVKCTEAEADAYARQIRSRGRAQVWEGKWAEAELMRQILESDDIVVRLEVSDKNRPPAE
jgi:hypothetical protein